MPETTKPPFVPRYLQGATLGAPLRQALCCATCARPLAAGRMFFRCLEGWHGRLLTLQALWERVRPKIPRKLWERLPRRLKEHALHRRILRRLLALAASLEVKHET